MTLIEKSLTSGVKDFIGGNCTVSLMLMGMAGLFQRDQIEWMTSMTYQAASGAGRGGNARAGGADGDDRRPRAGRCSTTRPRRSWTSTARSPNRCARAELPKENVGYPLAGSLLPWIDKDLGNGQSREEWKAQAEANKILGPDANGGRSRWTAVCVRVGAMRCHSQALTIKLRRPVPLDEVEGMLAEAHDWVKVVPNRREESLAELTPAAVTGSCRSRSAGCASSPWGRTT